MRLLNPEFDLNQFYADLADADGPVLLLDYDGTLAPFVEDRDQAVPYPGVRDRLITLLKDGRTRVVIISGRTTTALLNLLDMEHPPELWGSHGLERRRPDGTRIDRPLPRAAREGIAEITQWIEQEGLESHAEVKPSGAAFHWRGLSANDAAGLRQTVIARWAAAAAQIATEIHEFDGGIELRVAGITKADAVRAILDETDDTQPVAYLGDDRTDEDAFIALKGRGLSVLVRPEFRDTAADIWITPPDELLEQLDRWH